MNQKIKKSGTTAAQSGTMERRDHPKNAAIPKSHTSRGNFD